MAFEETQPKNPYQIIKNQHIFPDSSIKRFVNQNGDVHVYGKKYKKFRYKKPSSEMFCLKRAWDKKTEIGLMKEIEDKFQTLAPGLIAGTTILKALPDHSIIEDFYALWAIRARLKIIPINDQHLRGILGTSTTFTKDEEELMENAGVAFIRKDGSVPGRFFAGDNVVRQMINWRLRFKHTRWGFGQVSKGELIVPDDPYNGYTKMIPLSKTTNRNFPEMHRPILF